MSKLIIAKIILSCVFGVVLYALFAFTMWELKPVNWGLGGRLFYGIFTVLLGVIVSQIEVKN
jgi:hypothetical protein